MDEIASTTQTSEFSEQDSDYRVIEPSAIGGLILGLLSPLALLGSVWWLVPALGAAANVVALHRLNRDSIRFGRKAALWGLGLSVAFAVAPIMEFVVSAAILARQAQPVADQWFEYLRQNKPEKAMMLQFGPTVRRPLSNDEGLWLYYRNDREAEAELRKFVQNPLVRTLLALGQKADARYYAPVAVATEAGRAWVVYRYTVTYEDHGKKTTFFVSMTLERKPNARPELNPWRIRSAAAGGDEYGAIPNDGSE